MRWMISIVVLAVMTAESRAQDPAVPLWQLNPFDRLTLTNGFKHDVDPVRLPKGTEFFVEDGTYVGRPGLPARREIQRLFLYRIRLQSNGLEYYVQGRHIEAIDLYEDLLLAEAQRLIGAYRFEEAYPYLERLAERDPDWPGLAEALVQYHREEGIRSDILGRPDRAFWSLVEALRATRALAEPDSLASSIEADIDRIADKWASERQRSNDYSEVRRIVARLESVRPDSPVAAKHRAEIARDVQTLLAEGESLQSQNEPLLALGRLETAAGMDPGSLAVRSALEEAYRTHAHLRVAVEKLPFLGGPLPQTQADRRVFPLLHLAIEAPVSGSNPPAWSSSILTSLEPPDSTDLKRFVLTLRPGLRWPDDKAVTPVDLERLLVMTCREDSPLYNPAFARLASGFKSELPDRLILDFRVPQPRPQSWFDMPFSRATTTPEGTQWLGLGPFIVQRRNRDQIDFRGRGTDSSVMAMVTEHAIDNVADRLAALQGNRVDVVTNLLPRQAEIAKSIARARVVSLSTPIVHVVQFNWNQRALRDRTLRRAIAYAIDRNAILERLGASSDAATLPSAPWPIGSFGYDSSILPRPYDPVLAKTLVAAVRRKGLSIPNLRLLHGGTQADRLVCEQMAAGLKAAGVEVALEAFDPASPSSRKTVDLVYTALTITEPVQDVVHVLTRDNPSLWNYASPWLRQAVVDLSQEIRVTETARLLPRLHRILHDDVALLPIWQETPYIVVSERVSGLSENPPSTYDGILQWKVRPGFEEAAWTTVAGDEKASTQ